ncbi:unannotated protein [freshwater metagenome]|uniref:Unannotated protein n=1 Tax=freshwater metagenome TaxID=449393 RepID=A0A6J6TFY3_9ZZZZ
MQKVKIGQPCNSPKMPKETSGTPLRTMPESTRPMIVMNRPIPTPIAYFNCSGTAENTADLNPVRTSRRMSRPSSTTSPMASAQVIWGARVKATKPLSPSPAATATGNRPIAPMRMVMSPATSAVAAVTIVIALSTSSVPPT